MIEAQYDENICMPRSNPLLMAFREVESRIATLQTRARDLFYAVVLFQKLCPECGEPELQMVRDALAVCANCSSQVDPTLVFQTCPDCESKLVLKVCHYWCPRCRQPVRSIYNVEIKVFNAAYFREKMQASRDQKRRKQEMSRQMFRHTHSDPLVMCEPMSIDQVPGLEMDLNAIIASVVPDELRQAVAEHFDLEVYRHHLMALVQGCVVEFEGIRQLIEDAKLDKIFRFVTAIFLEHEGLLEIEQIEGGRLRLAGK
ncbi:hypothetical protein PDESU_02049 [Pontiella desulfatans]|jgi:hypothetical protein|uniref:Uncharacterized protein n=1 Tax=Pontiella desulfatans TaxID=2750659 RepID=A0A6C2U0P0_PONDE|nr:hypothetical protein [Pontiella desulfatans]VGO13492.1 hypothetical protein PDESU_02049 [Pontiella desulfatans]